MDGMLDKSIVPVLNFLKLVTTKDYYFKFIGNIHIFKGKEKSTLKYFFKIYIHLTYIHNIHTFTYINTWDCCKKQMVCDPHIAARSW